MNDGTLYICPTPIGNIKDMTLRAIELLKNVDLILCEDTRVSIKILNHYEIKTKMKSYHKFNEKQSVNEIISLIKEGKNIALISDAGTPIISDPGSELLKCAIEAKIKIIPLAGASAVTTFMSGVYNPSGQFLFLGFLPKKSSEKGSVLRKFKAQTIVFYESPNRLVKTLEEINQISPNAKIAVGRELTKVFEEIKQGQIEEIFAHYKQNPPRGEIAVAIIGETQNNSDIDLNEQILKLNSLGYSVNDISKILSALFNVSKKDVYQAAVLLTKN
ncbi:MAG: 16S rRNA (cytidine(1402)-2'-O)-methyltransferase [bacterium]